MLKERERFSTTSIHQDGQIMSNLQFGLLDRFLLHQPVVFHQVSKKEIAIFHGKLRMFHGKHQLFPRCGAISRKIHPFKCLKWHLAALLPRQRPHLEQPRATRWRVGRRRWGAINFATFYGGNMMISHSSIWIFPSHMRTQVLYYSM